MTHSNKQVLNCKARHGITSAQSREHQRAWGMAFLGECNWKAVQEMLNEKLPRQHLNYEIVKSGRMPKIDTSKPIPQWMAETLAARGINIPNIGRRVTNVRLWF